MGGASTRSLGRNCSRYHDRAGGNSTPGDLSERSTAKTAGLIYGHQSSVIGRPGRGECYFVEHSPKLAAGSGRCSASVPLRLLGTANIEFSSLAGQRATEVVYTKFVG